MSEELTTKEWLEGELAAVETKINEVILVKAQYLESYTTAMARLEKGKHELFALLAEAAIKEKT
ncbi:unnamed protein product [marine sediment metagenome]|uniref:Uncharacterized protein n=1 Tax=marine sediment metagenome TaxID=412755 RepID=X1HK52_9ZZZZ